MKKEKAPREVKIEIMGNRWYYQRSGGIDDRSVQQTDMPNTAKTLNQPTKETAGEQEAHIVRSNN